MPPLQPSFRSKWWRLSVALSMKTLRSQSLRTRSTTSWHTPSFSSTTSSTTFPWSMTLMLMRNPSCANTTMCTWSCVRPTPSRNIPSSPGCIHTLPSFLSHQTKTTMLWTVASFWPLQTMVIWRPPIVTAVCYTVWRLLYNCSKLGWQSRGSTELPLWTQMGHHHNLMWVWRKRATYHLCSVFFREWFLLEQHFHKRRHHAPQSAKSHCQPFKYCLQSLTSSLGLWLLFATETLTGKAQQGTIYAVYEAMD